MVIETGSSLEYLVVLDAKQVRGSSGSDGVG